MHASSGSSRRGRRSRVSSTHGWRGRRLRATARLRTAACRGTLASTTTPYTCNARPPPRRQPKAARPPPRRRPKAAAPTRLRGRRSSSGRCVPTRRRVSGSFTRLRCRSTRPSQRRSTTTWSGSTPSLKAARSAMPPSRRRAASPATSAAKARRRVRATHVVDCRYECDPAVYDSLRSSIPALTS